MQSDKQNTKIAKKTVNKETQKKSQALGKDKGKKLQGKCKELQDRQSLQSQTGPREIRQSSSQPTKAPNHFQVGLMTQMSLYQSVRN